MFYSYLCFSHRSETKRAQLEKDDAMYFYQVLQWLSLSLHSNRVLDLNFSVGLGLYMGSLLFSTHVGFHQVLQLPPQPYNMQVRLTGSTKLPAGVKVSVYGCLPLCVDELAPSVLCVPIRSFSVSWDYLQSPCNTKKDMWL